LFSALSGAGVRKALVAFQFALSVGMIFVALMMWKQTDFLLNREVGYDKHNVINVWMPVDLMRPTEALKEKLMEHPAVNAVAYSGASPMEINGFSEVKWNGMPTERKTYLYGATIDFDVIPALRMRVVVGRNFSRDFASDSNNFVINRKAADLMGFKDPVGQRITYTMFGERTGEIVGVIDDFNNDDIHLPIAPVVLIIGRSTELFNLFVRYEEGQLEPALTHVRKVCAELYPGATFNHSFLDEDFQNQMYREMFLGKISIALTAMAIFISVLGLLGLTLFSVERRTKEVGIRKVLGASVPQVMVLFFREFFRPTLIAFSAAFPLAYYFVQQYLESFAFKVPITAIPFLVVALSSTVLILVLVSFHSYRAAITNPVEVLKHE
jgi:putative ABC transport system permease protein